MRKKALGNSYSQKHNNYAKQIGRITNQFFRSQLLVFCNYPSSHASEQEQKRFPPPRT